MPQSEQLSRLIQSPDRLIDVPQIPQLGENPIFERLIEKQTFADAIYHTIAQMKASLEDGSGKPKTDKAESELTILSSKANSLWAETMADFGYPERNSNGARTVQRAIPSIFEAVDKAVVSSSEKGVTFDSVRGKVALGTLKLLMTNTGASEEAQKIQEAAIQYALEKQEYREALAQRKTQERELFPWAFNKRGERRFFRIDDLQQLFDDDTVAKEKRAPFKIRKTVENVIKLFVCERKERQIEPHEILEGLVLSFVAAPSEQKEAIKAIALRLFPGDLEHSQQTPLASAGSLIEKAEVYWSDLKDPQSKSKVVLPITVAGLKEIALHRAEGIVPTDFWSCLKEEDWFLLEPEAAVKRVGNILTDLCQQNRPISAATFEKLIPTISFFSELLLVGEDKVNHWLELVEAKSGEMQREQEALAEVLSLW